MNPLSKGVPGKKFPGTTNIMTIEDKMRQLISLVNAGANISLTKILQTMSESVVEIEKLKRELETYKISSE